MGAGKRVLRLFFALVVLTSGATLVDAYVDRSLGFDTNADAGSTQGNRSFAVGEKVAPSASGTTVLTTSERRRGDERDNLLIAIGADGRVRYRNDSHVVYNDVDPVANTSATVLYVGADRLPRSACGGTSDCWRNVVETVNISTGEVERIYEYATPVDRGQWHDVDRLDEDHLVVADIAADRVFVVNTTTGIVTWEWDAQSAFPLTGGGLFPGDWTHVNDVEVLPDGRLMVSLRNQDQVVFLDRETGLVRNWTLGEENDYSILNEQHNPDYIPQERGGPAILVADSENDRVVEYQREDGTWTRTWMWRDLTLQWPRDADRLPDGHTLITDSNGGRVFEVGRDGSVVWTLPVDGAYDAERLGTGDESAGGESARKIGLASRGGNLASSPRQVEDLTLRERIGLAVKDTLPGLLVNAALYVLPSWIGFVELAAILVLIAGVLAWAGAELWWSGWSIRVSSGEQS